jgi:hypothetical protein
MGSGLAETDWWLGGEEARGSFWGPRQGDFLGEALLACVAAHGGDADAVDWEEPPAVDLPELAAEALAPDGSTGGGAVYLDVDAEYGPTDRVSFTVTGGDPLLGAPLARLLDADGDRVLRPGGQPYDSDDQSFTVDLGMTPAWDAVPGPSVRTFYWTFTLLPRHKVAGVMDLPAGSYRFEVDVPLDGGNARTVESSLFTLLAD